MSKYIRTKDGIIYEIIEETENSFELCNPIGKKMGCSCIMIKRIPGSNQKPTYRLADTIEELCDEFVIKGTRGRYLGIPLQECKLRNIPITQIYGAIWTDKGLQFVARMNNEGKLELI